MLKIEEADRRFILENLPDGAVMIEHADLRGLLDKLDSLELEKGYDGAWEDGINDFGRQIERIIDRLFYENTENK